MQYTLQREIFKKVSQIAFVLQICNIIPAYDRYTHFCMNCTDPSFIWVWVRYGLGLDYVWVRLGLG